MPTSTRDLDIELRTNLKADGKNFCVTCQAIKPLSEFYNNEHRCKTCCVARVVKAKRTRKTGWTQEEYDAAFLLQNGKCYICKEPPSEKRQLAADHCHVTGTRRKLLCSECNLILGKAKDNPAILRAAAAYLEEAL